VTDAPEADLHVDVLEPETPLGCLGSRVLASLVTED